MMLLVLASLLCQAEAVARWTFDGDVKDSGPAALPTRAVGRLEFIDSPVSGKAAVFNGVDAFVQVDPPGKLGAGSGDFSLSAWILSLDRRTSPLFSRTRWSLQQLDGGALRLAVGNATVSTSGGALPAGRWNHLVVTLKRKAGAFEAVAYVNGDEFRLGTFAESDLDPSGEPFLIGRSVDDGRFFAGLIDDVRLYSRELGSEAVMKLTDEGMAWIRPKPHAKSPFPGKFELLENDVVVFAGGENARVGQELGYLEALLALQASGKRVRFRNMAWEGDTVYEQMRPLNFGTWGDHLRRVGASVVVAQFGQVEALEGKPGVGRFAAAYEALVSQFAATTRRIVLVSPTPFGRGSARQPELTARNEDLGLYVEEIRKIAAKHGALFVDLSTKTMADEGFTRDGLHLTGIGQWAAARETARQLEIPGLSDLDAPDATGAFRRESLEKIRLAIGTKNGLWNRSWRPANWAFLNGDRTEQPSSRDHLDRRIRWYPVEVQQLPAMVLREEEKIESLLQTEKK
jgi:hypothetical protein